MCQFFVGSFMTTARFLKKNPDNHWIGGSFIVKTLRTSELKVVCFLIFLQKLELEARTNSNTRPTLVWS